MKHKVRPSVSPARREFPPKKARGRVHLAAGSRHAAFLEIVKELASQDDPERIFALICERVCQLLSTDSACLCVVEGDEIVYCGSYGLPAEIVGAASRHKIAESRVGRIVLTGRPFAVPDATADPHWRESEIVTRWGYRALLETPIILRGEVIGAMAALNKTPREFFAQNVGVLSALADHTALALDRTRSHARTQTQLREIETLLAVSQAVSSTLDLTEVLRRVARETGRALGADMVGAFLADPDERYLRPLAGWHVPKHVLETFVEFPIPLKGHRILEEAWEHRRPVWSSDVAADPRIDRASFERFPHRSNLFFPLVVKGEPIGGLFVTWWEQTHEFTSEELRLVEGISRQAALAIENAQLYEEAGQRRREAEVLAELAGSITASLDLDTILRRVVNGARDLCGADVAQITLLESGSEAVVLSCCTGVSSPAHDTVRVEPEKGVGGQVLRTGRPFRTDHYAEDPRVTKDYLPWIQKEGIVTTLVVPIRLGNRIEGLLFVDRRSPSPFTDRDEAILQRLADHAAVAIQNARLHEAAERRRRAAESLAEVGRLISQSLDSEEVGQRIVDSVQRLLAVKHSILYRLEPESRDLTVLAVSGELGPYLSRGLVLARGTGLVGVAVRDGCSTQTPNLETDPRVTFTPEAWASIERAPFRAVLAVPLLVQDRVIGALTLGDQTGRVFDAEEIRLAEAFAAQAALALERARLYEAVKAARDFLESIAVNSADAIVTTDLQGRLTYFSRGAEAIFGVRAEEVLGRRVADYYRGGVEEARSVMRRLIAEGRFQHYETASQVKDGRWIDLDCSGALLKDAAGTVIGTLGVGRDITERKRTEEVLRESEERFRRAFEDSAIGMALQATDGRYLRVNRTLCEMLGRAEQELLGMDYQDVTHPDDLAADVGNDRQMLAGEREWCQHEKRYLHKEGRAVWVLASISLARDRGGRPMYFVVQVQDITERKRAEEKLRQLAERVGTLREIDRAILAARSPAEIAAVGLRHVRRLLPATRAGITVYDLGAAEATVLAVDVDGDTALGVGVKVPLGTFGDLEAFRRGAVVAVEDLLALPTPSPIYQALLAEGLRSCLYVPLLAHGALIGSLNLGAAEPGTFRPEHVRIAREVADSLAVALHNARLFDQVRAGRDRLHALARQLVKVQETERRHIARELHDEIGQALTALKLTLDRSTRSTTDKAGVRQAEAQALVHELMTRVREISLDLRPAMLDDLGLLPALLWHIERYTARTGLKVTFQHTGLERRFPPEVETAAYRIVQEALSNVARHAAACGATVWLWVDADALRVQIEDEGVGFDVEAVLAAGATSGLAGMRERTILLGGRLIVESAPGAGSRVTAELPLATGP